MYEQRNSYLLKAIENNEFNYVKTVFASSSDDKRKEIFKNSEYFFRAIIKGHLEIIKLFVEFGADINQLSPPSLVNGNALRFVPSNGLAIMRYLIENGINVNYHDEQGRTALYYWVAQCDRDAVSMLLAAGAEISGTGPGIGMPYSSYAEKKTLLHEIEYDLFRGSQAFPKMIETGRDKEGNPIYRQQSKSGIPTTTCQENRFIKKHLNNSPTTSELVALSLFKCNAPLAETLSGWGIAKELELSDIRHSLEVSKINNDKGTNSAQFKQLDNEAIDFAKKHLNPTI